MWSSDYGLIDRRTAIFQFRLRRGLNREQLLGNASSRAAFDPAHGVEYVMAAAVRLTTDEMQSCGIPPEAIVAGADLPNVASVVKTQVANSSRTLAARCANAVHDFNASLRSRVEATTSWWRTIAENYNSAYEELDRRAESARFHAISNRFNHLASLNEDEARIVHDANYAGRQTHQAGAEIVSEGELLRPTYIASGWACRVKVIDEARRQITGFLLPGDGLGLQADCAQSSTSIIALTTLETADARAVIVAAQERDANGLREGLRRAAAQEKAFLSNQILRLGALGPAERLLHLLLELRWRLNATQLNNGPIFPFPLTRETLSQSLCVSVGKIRGGLNALRRRRLINVGYGRAKLLKPGIASDRTLFQPPATCSCVERRLIDDTRVGQNWSPGLALH